MKNFFTFFLEKDAALMAVIVFLYWGMNIGLAGYFLYKLYIYVGPLFIQRMS